MFLLFSGILSFGNLLQEKGLCVSQWDEKSSFYEGRGKFTELAWIN